MIEIGLTLAGLTLVLILDIALVATRSSFMSTSHGRLLALREQNEADVSRVMRLLAGTSHLKASLNLALVLTRFGLAGLVVLFPFLLLAGISPWVVTLFVALAALALFWFEWGMETLVGRNPEYWAVRLSRFAGLMTFLMGVFLIPLRISGDEEDASETTSLVTEDEVKFLVDAGQEEGVFELGERRMIHSIFQLGETLAA